MKCLVKRTTTMSKQLTERKQQEIGVQEEYKNPEFKSLTEKMAKAMLLMLNIETEENT